MTASCYQPAVDMLAVQFVMSVATDEGCRMAAETFGINYLASDTVQVKYP